MKKCPRDLLRLQLQGTDSGAESQRLREHLAICPECREEQKRLLDQGRIAAAPLDLLDPSPLEVSKGETASRKFRGRASAHAESERGFWARLRGGFFQPAPTGLRHSGAIRGRTSLVAGMVLALGVLLVSFGPARRVLAEFLQIFRVRQFSVIPIDQERLNKLEALSRDMRGALPVNPEVERQPVPPRAVRGAREASAAAGFSVQTPAGLPPEAILREFSVGRGPAVRVDYDRDRVQSRLDSLGFRDIRLPPMAPGSVRVDVPYLVSQRYDLPGGAGHDTSTVVITQLRSPTVSVPSGVDPQALGRVLLQVLGLSSADAEKLSTQIDWTSTLVLPIPRNWASVQELQLKGSTAVLLQTRPQPPAYIRVRALLWQKDGVLFAVQGQGIPAADLVQLAESMH